MSAKVKLALDIIERAVKTYLQAFIGLLVVANVWTSTEAGHLLGILEAGQVAAVAAIPMGLSVISSGLSALLGRHDSAAALPAEAD